MTDRAELWASVREEEDEERWDWMLGTFEVSLQGPGVDDFATLATGLAINDALALARARADRVTVWAGDHDPWDAGQIAGEFPRWPPDDLDLRPRWSHEPPTTLRPPGWWVTLQLRDTDVTADELEQAALALPDVIWAAGARVPLTGTRAVLANQLGLRKRTVQVVCLRATSDQRAATYADELESHLPEPPPPRPPARVRLLLLLDLIRARRGGRSYIASRPGIEVVRVEPATAGQMERPADRLDPPPDSV